MPDLHHEPASPRSGRVCDSATYRLSRADFREELAFRFEPIGAGIARQTKAVAALGDEIGAGADHLVGWLGSGGWRHELHARFGSPRASRGFLAHQLGWAAFLWL